MLEMQIRVRSPRERKAVISKIAINRSSSSGLPGLLEAFDRAPLR